MPQTDTESHTPAWRQRRFWVFLALALALVCLASWLKGQYGDKTDGTWPSIRGPLLDVFLTLSGALVIALAIGFLIDAVARERLAGKLAEGWLWGLLGPDAPPQIQKCVKDRLAERVIMSLAEVHVEFTWVGDEPNGVLRLFIQSIQAGKNYGPDPFCVQPSTQLIPSATGYESRVTKWEFEVIPGDTSQETRHKVFSAEELAAIKAKNPGVVTSLSGGDLEVPADLEARRGDGFRLARCAEVFLGSSDTFPMSERRPTLNYKLIVSGNAVPDLDLEVLSSRGPLEPVNRTAPRHETEYSLGPALGGDWIWLCWEPQAAPQLPGTEDEPRSSDA